MLGEGLFILVNFQEGPDGNYIEYKNDVDTLCKILLVIKYLDGIRQPVWNI